MMKRDYTSYLAEVKKHLHDELLPYWRDRGDDPEFGGFITFFDRGGNPTGETEKNLLANCRMIYTFSSINRTGHDPDGSFLERATRGIQFVQEHFRDPVHQGWYWILQRDGTPVDRKKIIYGHSFVIYAFSEYAMAAKDSSALDVASQAFELLQLKAADNLFGGYYEFFEQDWSYCRPGAYGGDRKSMDVHMHLMEAFTNLYQASGDSIHKRRACEIIELICTRMLHPEHGTGIAQFSPDFTPQRAIIFKNVWGSDREADDQQGRPLDNTSFGHNVEFAWLLNHSIDVLGLERSKYSSLIRKLYDHFLSYGLDREHGGVYCEGPHQGEAREKNKEFWQQGETLVAMLDAVSRFNDERYWQAYINVHRFVFDHMINHEIGEWLPLLGAKNEVIWDYMNHAWKINYHTVRSMLECERRLGELAS